MHLNKIEFQCSNCGWKASIPEQWTDIKPTYCGNSRCDYSAKKATKTKKSFRTDPSALKIKKPSTDKLKTKTASKKKSRETKSNDRPETTRIKRQETESTSSD